MTPLTRFGETMAREPARRPRLTDRDFQIFEHLARYRLTTPEILHRLFFSDSKINAVTKVTSRLAEHGFLNSYDLYGSRIYHKIGPNAAKWMGISQNRTKGFGRQALVQEYGALEFCCGGEELRNRLLVREIQQKDPDLLAAKVESNRYYLDRHDGEHLLGFMRVDFCGELPNLIDGLRGEVDRRYEHEAFRKLIDARRFLIAVVTVSEERKEEIRLALRRRQWPVPFRIEVVPNLIHLIARFQT